MAETGGPQAAAEPGRKRKIQRHYASESFLGMNRGETDLQSTAGTAYAESSADCGILYLNPLTPKWNCGIIAEEEDASMFQNKVKEARQFEEARTTEQAIKKLKLLKVKTTGLVPETSNGTSMEYCADISSMSPDEIWVQSEEIGEEGRIFKHLKMLKNQKLNGNQISPMMDNGSMDESIGKEGRIFNHLIPTFKMTKNQKLNGNQVSPIMDKSQWVPCNDDEVTFVETTKTFTQATLKLKPQSAVKSMLNPRMDGNSGVIIETCSDFGASQSTQTKMLLKRKDNIEETARTSITQKTKVIVPEHCTISPTKQTTKTFTQATLNLKPQSAVKSMLNAQIDRNRGVIIETCSDFVVAQPKNIKMLLKRKDNIEETARTSIAQKTKLIVPEYCTISPTKHTQMLLRRKDNIEETTRTGSTQKTKIIVPEHCTISPTKQPTNEDCTMGDCAEILHPANQETDILKSKVCAKDHEDAKSAEGRAQVTSKLKDLQVKENQLDEAKLNMKCKDDSKISRLLEAMKKRSEIDTEPRPFKCSHCHWAFKKLCYLQSHITTHSGLKPHVCDICGKAYSHQGTLQQHKRLHTGERPYCCPFCDRSYIWSSDYRKHIRTHTGEKPYACKECGKDFIRSSDLRKHERNRHTNNKPFPCSHCGKTFNKPLSLKRHERKHLGERPYSCPECGKKFALASRMADHQKIHKGVRPFVCSVCSKRFTKSSNLTEHEAIHSGIRPHKCEECGVAFAMASRLIRHQYVHNKGKPHCCAGCGRNFSGLASLEQHQQQNCAARIFVCVQCDKSFMCADKLTQHMLHHDKIEST